MISFAVLPGDRPELARTKRLFTTVLWVSIVSTGFTVSQYVRYDAVLVAWVVTLPGIAAAVALTAMKVRPSTYPGVLHLVIAATIVVSAANIVLLGGILESANGTTWSVLALVGGAVVFADRRAHIWLVIFVVTTLLAILVASRTEPFDFLPNPEFVATFNILLVVGIIYPLFYYFVRKSESLYQESESLLLNVLPEEVADRLKASDEMIADDFESASILFADLVGFTPMSSEMEPGEVITMLNEVFSEFDRMVEERNLEKIRTIGDAYMVAAGVPVPVPDHARAICDLAVEMMSAVQTRSYQGKSLQLRIGISSGAVVAGIIGRRKFSYDLWGDTVNTASRMESTGVPGQIQITGATRNLIGEDFICESRGPIEVKGKGLMETWFLLGHR